MEGRGPGMVARLPGWAGLASPTHGARGVSVFFRHSAAAGPARATGGFGCKKGKITKNYWQTKPDRIIVVTAPLVW